MLTSISRIAFAAADLPSGTGTPVPVATPSVAVKPRKPAAQAAAKPATKPGKSAKPAKPGKPAAKKASAVIEPETDKRAERAERIAADRATVSGFYATFETHRASVPVKPVRGFKLQTTTAHPIERHPSTRQIAAIAVAFAAAGTKLLAGGKAARCFDHAGVNSAIENGVLRDAVSSGLIVVHGASPEAETLTLTKAGAAYAVSQLGEKRLKQAKLL